MSNVAQITPYLKNVEAPAAIRDLQAWVIWRLEHDPAQEKPRKVPYYANGGKRVGQQGGPDDVARLVTFDAAKAAAARRGFDGVGFATLEQFGICALDFDDCITDGKITPDVSALLADTYAEFSPSGRGVRVLFKGNLGNKKDTSRGAYGYGMEVFSTKGFVTFTGNTLDITELLGNDDVVSPISESVMALYARRFPIRETPKEYADVPEASATTAEIEALLAKIDPDIGHDEWLHTGMAIHYETHGEGFALWDTWSANGGKYPGTETLYQRWLTFGRNDGPPVTIRTVMKLAGVTPSTPASADEFEALVEDVKPSTSTENSPMKFVVLPAHEFASAAPASWRIKGVLPDAELAVMYGASGSGKSFVALDMGAAIARGVEWRGRKVRPGRVAYIAAEGAGGFRKRLTAYAQQNQVDLASIPFGVINAAPNMMEKSDAAAVAKAVKAWGGADIIIVDTFAQVMPGANENAGEDVGKALTHCKRIHEATGAMILLIHHAGKDAAKGARGWSGLRAAADAELEVVREPMGRSLRLTKSKDGEDGLMWGFELDVVQIGVDEDLDPITSCVVVEHEIPVGGVSTRALGKNEKVVNEVIQEIAQGQSIGIEVKFVLDEATKRLRGDQKDAKGNFRTRARKALLSLCEGDDAPYYLDPETNCVEIL